MTNHEPPPAAHQRNGETDPIQTPTVEEAFRNLYPSLVNQARRRSEEPEDIVQTVFVNTLAYLQGRPDTPLTAGWYATATGNAIINAWRYGSRRPIDYVDPSTYGAELPDARAASDFEHAETYRELLVSLEHIADALSDKPKWLEIFVRSKLLEQPYKQISEEMDIPLGSVASALKRTMDRLKENPELRARYDVA